MANTWDHQLAFFQCGDEAFSHRCGRSQSLENVLSLLISNAGSLGTVRGIPKASFIRLTEIEQELPGVVFVTSANVVNNLLKEHSYRCRRVTRPTVEFLSYREWIKEESVVSQQ
jgi:hypothetical protein